MSERREKVKCKTLWRDVDEGTGEGKEGIKGKVDPGMGDELTEEGKGAGRMDGGRNVYATGWG